jgi:hypothetical protein
VHLLTKEKMSEFPHSDVQLSGIEWLPDCAMRFALVLGDNRAVRLTCTWITQLRMGLDFGKNSGKAMTWEINYVQQDSRWKIRMDFAHTGSIEFSCEEAKLEDAPDH